VAAHAERRVDVVAPRRAGVREPLGDVLEAVHLEAEVVDAGPVLAALDAGHRVVLELQDGQVEVAVGEVVAAGVRIVDPADLLHAEHVDVELCRRLGILRGQRDVLDLRHGSSSPRGTCRIAYRGGADRVECPGRTRLRGRRRWATGG